MGRAVVPGKVLVTVISVAIAVIGLGGLPDDVVTWWSWLESVEAEATGNAGRWLLVVSAVLLFLGVNVLPAVGPKANGLIRRLVASESRDMEQAVAENNEPRKDGVPPKRRKRPRITTTSRDIKITGSRVELSRWVYPTETKEIICKVRRPDGDLDYAIASPTVGLASTIRRVYPDDFRDAPPLTKGEYQFVWTESTWREINRGLQVTATMAVFPPQHERYEHAIGSGGFTVR